MRNNIKKILIAFLFVVSIASCKKYLDIVPDNVATIENAFSLRVTAERYLYTCYSFLPDLGNPTANMAMFSGDELWLELYPFTEFNANAWEIARGNQNVNDPLLNYWDGRMGGKNLWIGIRDCNIFLENILKVPDMRENEKMQWIAEVKFLKAYYYFFLLRMYGPVPIMNTNLPISTSPEDVQLARQPVDSVFNYIVGLLNEAEVDLPPTVLDENSDLGRITLPICKTLKAEVLVYEASPLFNGNPDFKNFTNNDGTHLFSQSVSKEKWEEAADACKDAIEMCQSLGYELYTFEETQQARNLSTITKTKLSLRNIITERWNKEIIWANPNSLCKMLQVNTMVPSLNPSTSSNSIPRGHFQVPLNIANLFYTKHGLPIEEDKIWDYEQRFQLRVSTTDDKYNVKEGYETVNLHFDREPRFYADLGFDGGIWYGQGKFNDDDNWYLNLKLGGAQSDARDLGYYPKKYINYTDVVGVSTFTIEPYPWVISRLGGLYLLYAEAVNEAYGPTDEALHYLNLVRERAGIPQVQDAWNNYSRHPNEYTTKDGLRKIIQRERQNEMAFEGQRFWDLRRWKTAEDPYNSPIEGWDGLQEDPNQYYRVKKYFQLNFRLRDYFWPIRQYNLTTDKNMTQNPGW